MRIPRQKLPPSQQTEKWAIDTAEAFISLSNFYNNSYKEEMRKLYDAYNGMIYPSDYNRFLHFGGSEKKSFPATIRNFPIIKPIIDLLLGDKRDRPFNYHVFAVNSDVQTIKEELKKEEVKKYLYNLWAKYLIETGINPGVEFKETPPLESILEHIENNYKDGRAIAGQHILNYVMQEQRVEMKLMEGFAHWLIAGEVFSYKGARRGVIEYDIVNPVELDYDMSPGVVFVEDGDWAIRRRFSHASNILDRHYEYLKAEHVEKLENPSKTGMIDFIGPINRTQRHFDARNDRLVEEIHVTWKTRKQVNVLTYIDEYNQVVEEIVDEGFNLNIFKANLVQKLTLHELEVRRMEIGEQLKLQLQQEMQANISPETTPEQVQQMEAEAKERLMGLVYSIPEQQLLGPEDISFIINKVAEITKLTTYWGNQVYEATRLDGDIWIKVQPIPVQRRLYDNYSTCKLPYNGRIYSNLNSMPVSLVSIGIPYQITYNIYKYRLELAIAKSRDVIGVFDINAIPKGWDIPKFMHFIDGTGIAWLDFSKEGIKLSNTMQSVMDLSIKTIQQYNDLLRSILEEWERVSGVSRQRQGDITQNDGLGTAQQAIVQSSKITEELFARFDEFVETDLNGILDYAKIAYSEGKKISYISSDYVQAMYTINPEDIAEAEHSVFVSNSSDQARQLQEAKQIANLLAQQGTAKTSTLLDFIDAKSVAIIKQKVKKAEAEAEQLAQAQAQAEQELAAVEQQRKDQELQLEYDRLQQEALDKELDRQNKIDIEQMKIEADMFGQDVNANGLPDSSEIEANQIKREELNFKQATQQMAEQNKMLDMLNKYRQQAEERSLKAAQIAEEINIKKEELKLKAKELELKEKDSIRKLQIARTNKNRHDK